MSKRINLLAAAVIALGGSWLVNPLSLDAVVSAAKCTTTIEYPDGTKKTIVIEGDKCKLDLKNGECTCE